MNYNLDLRCKNCRAELTYTLIPDLNYECFICKHNLLGFYGVWHCGNECGMDVCPLCSLGTIFFCKECNGRISFFKKNLFQDSKTFQCNLCLDNFLVEEVYVLDIYASSEAVAVGDGTQAYPYSNLVSVFTYSTSDTSIKIILLTNSKPYTIDSPLNITKNYHILFQSSGQATIDFAEGGSLNLQGPYSFILEKIQISQSDSNYTTNNSPIEIKNAALVNLTGCLFTNIKSNITIMILDSTIEVIFYETAFKNLNISTNLINIANTQNLVTIKDCEFSGSNISGAYYIYMSDSRVDLKSSYFSKNIIYQTDIDQTFSLLRIGSSANISSTTFENNLLVNTSLIAIGNDQPNNEILIQISNKVLFISNSQTLEMALAMSIVGENIQVIMQENVTFQYNYAPASFVFISDTLNTADIRDVFLINNFGFEMIALQMIKNITIFDISCTENGNYEDNFYLIDAKSEENTPGNCLSIVNYVNLYIQNSNFTNNFAVSTLTGVLIEHTADVVSLGISANSAQAFISQIKCIYNMVNATLNNIINNGNCFLLLNSGGLSITNSEISYNVNNVDLEADYSGNPCLISDSNDNDLIILDTNFIRNQAYSECSCLNFHGNNLYMKNVKFLENRSIKLSIGNDLPTFYVDNEGGCMNLGAENITMENIWIYNSSAMKGGGIFFHNKNSKNFQNLLAYNLSILKNEGIQTAGIEFDASLILGEYIFTNSVINYNKVEFYGTISTFYYTSFNIHFLNSDVSYNWGISAGAAFSFYHFGGLIYINETTMIGNVLNQSVFVGGAALFLYGTTFYTNIRVTGCKFINNTSTLKGGAIQTMYGQVHASNSEFIDNQALYGGAASVAIYCPGSYVNVTVRNQYPANQGGAFHFTEQSQVDLKNVSIYDCQANQGGGIYLDGSQMVFKYENLNFYNVKANEGAAIWLLNTLADETFFYHIYIQDSETSSSSLINIDSVNIVLTNLTIKNSKGRAIFINNSTVTINGGLVSDHFCEGNDNQGCFSYIQDVCVIEVSDIHFKNLISQFIEDIFSISDTNIAFTNITFDNCSSDSETILATASESTIILSNSIIENLSNALLQISDCEFIVVNCTFKNISSSTEFAILQITSAKNFIIDYSNFFQVSGYHGGCITLLSGSPIYNYTISNVVVKNCSAYQGAGLYISEQNALIENCSFIGNFATDGGGGIYFYSILDQDYQWDIFSSFFFNNTATQGGAFHSMRYIPNVDNESQFTNNKAKYGNDFSAFPVKLSLEIDYEIINCDSTPDLCYLRTGITSGQTMPPILISVLDYYGQKMTLLDGLGFLDLTTSTDQIDFSQFQAYDNFTENFAISRTEAVFTGVKTQRLINGTFNFSEAVIQSQPPSNAWIKVKSDLITTYYSDLLPQKTFFNYNDKTTGDYYFLFKIFFRECVSGEVYFNNGTECNVCPKGKYSFFPSDSDCKTCPVTAQCEGGNHFALDPGYWRPDIYSDDVYSCNILTESCLGGENSSCLNGYTGIICGSCTFNDDQKFFKKGMYFCEECANVYIYIIIIVVGVVIIFGFIIFLVTRKTQNTENYVLVKIITNHVQTVSFLSNIKIEFPKFLKGFNSAQAPATSIDSFVFTIECFKDSLSITIFEVKLILSIIITAAMILVVITGYSIIGYRKKYSSKKTINDIINALVVIASFFQPPFINFYIQNLSCDSINNHKYMTYNLEQECWNSSHLTYSLLITIPFLIFWMAIFPLIFLVYMRKHRDNLEEPNVKQITRFFQAGYKKNMYFWEFIQMLRKFSVILLTTFLRNNPQSVVYILIPVIAFFFILQIANMPYETSTNLRYNFLEILSLNACFITYYSAVFYLRVISDISKTFFLIVILIVNGIFLFIWIQKYLLVLKGRITQIISDFSKKSHRDKEAKLSSYDSRGGLNSLSKANSNSSKRVQAKK